MDEQSTPLVPDAWSRGALPPRRARMMRTATWIPIIFCLLLIWSPKENAKDRGAVGVWYVLLALWGFVAFAYLRSRSVDRAMLRQNVRVEGMLSRLRRGVELDRAAVPTTRTAPETPQPFRGTAFKLATLPAQEP
mmetsp:Transcript_24985/g.54918  ORF Transcript_24985/g.54918 Transcript_24985/m.54918 type:complete len:135 (+) Transcript_24985:28-432(+)